MSWGAFIVVTVSRLFITPSHAFSHPLRVYVAHARAISSALPQCLRFIRDRGRRCGAPPRMRRAATRRAPERDLGVLSRLFSPVVGGERLPNLLRSSAYCRAHASKFRRAHRAQTIP